MYIAVLLLPIAVSSPSVLCLYLCLTFSVFTGREQPLSVTIYIFLEMADQALVYPCLFLSLASSAFVARPLFLTCGYLSVLHTGLGLHPRTIAFLPGGS